MNTLYVTYCSGKKDKKEKEKSIPAIESYNSDRIRWVYNLSIKDKVDFAILSGVLGLLYPEDNSQKEEYFRGKQVWYLLEKEIGCRIATYRGSL